MPIAALLVASGEASADALRVGHGHIHRDTHTYDGILYSGALVACRAEMNFITSNYIVRFFTGFFRLSLRLRCSNLCTYKQHNSVLLSVDNPAIVWWAKKMAKNSQKPLRERRHWKALDISSASPDHYRAGSRLFERCEALGQGQTAGQTGTARSRPPLPPLYPDEIGSVRLGEVSHPLY